MYLIFLTLFLIGIAGIVCFNKKNRKYYKFAIASSLVAFSLFCAFAPFETLQGKLSTIDPLSEKQVDRPHSTTISSATNVDYVVNTND